MRTTITLDEDVASRLKAEVRRTGYPFKRVVNDLLRLAMTTRRKRGPAEPFKVKTRPLGLRPGFNLDRISELIEQLEGPFHR